MQDLSRCDDGGIDGRQCGCHSDKDVVRVGSPRVGSVNHISTISICIKVDVKPRVEYIRVGPDIEHSEARGIDTRVKLREEKCHVILVGAAAKTMCEVVVEAGTSAGGHGARLHHGNGWRIVDTLHIHGLTRSDGRPRRICRPQSVDGVIWIPNSGQLTDGYQLYSQIQKHESKRLRGSLS
mgnify:FL=1